jgi:putative transcriptional regulator
MKSEKAQFAPQIAAQGRGRPAARRLSALASLSRPTRDGALRAAGRRSAWLLLAFFLAGLFAPPARAANHQNHKLLFLVARSQLQDPIFKQSVVLMLPLVETPIEVGLILNKTSPVPLSKLFPDVPAIAARNEPIRFGGPVDVHVPGLIFHSAKPPDNSLQLYGDVYVIFDADQISALVGSLPPASKMLFLFGRAQWSPEQLANEIHRGDWYPWHEDGSMIFTADPKTLWRTLHARAAPSKYIRYEIPSRPLPKPKQVAAVNSALRD